MKAQAATQQAIDELQVVKAQQEQRDKERMQEELREKAIMNAFMLKYSAQGSGGAYVDPVMLMAQLEKDMPDKADASAAVPSGTAASSSGPAASSGDTGGTESAPTADGHETHDNGDDAQVLCAGVGYLSG